MKESVYNMHEILEKNKLDGIRLMVGVKHKIASVNFMAASGMDVHMF